MISFTLLILILLILIAGLIVTVSVFGAAGAVVFGDAIVCVLLIALLIKKLISNS